MTGDKLIELAQEVGDDWKNHAYYEDVERFMDGAWRKTIWPIIQGADFSVVVDLGAGHGRNTAKLREVSKKIYVVDINRENIDFCKQRFTGDDRLVFIQNDGASLADIPNGEVSLIYSFDSMVHFDSDVVRAYLRDFRRVLKPGGLGFCHHSNYTGNPGGRWMNNPHIRNFMSQSLFAHYCAKEGLSIVRSETIDWGNQPKLDCLTLFRRPAVLPLLESRDIQEKEHGIRVLTSAAGLLVYLVPPDARMGKVEIVVTKHPWSGILTVLDEAERILHEENLFAEKSAVVRIAVPVAAEKKLQLRVKAGPLSQGTEAWIHSVELR
jgi:SAM-dependent methyltransferase